jgi:hypothetical protein
MSSIAATALRRQHCGDTPGKAEPERRKGYPFKLISGMVGHNASVGIALGESNVLGTMPGGLCNLKNSMSDEVF